MKVHHNVGRQAKLSFFRDAHGLEVDLLIEHGVKLAGVEAKSGATVPLEMFAPLEAVARLVPEMRTRIVMHGGTESWTTRAGQALSYQDIDSRDWTKN
jgi:hypothetical protein